MIIKQALVNKHCQANGGERGRGRQKEHGDVIKKAQTKQNNEKKILKRFLNKEEHPSALRCEDALKCQRNL